ncbi:MAG: hypothetical protein PUB86_07285 [Elusimicrobia bacterium]|nr:hypothetical protein [Elusimicrobiota bacterium]
MIKNPFIFLTQNFARQIVDADGADISAGLANITTTDLPYTVTLFFTDKWGQIVNRTIDTLILQNTNIGSIVIEAADNSGNYSPMFTISDNTDGTVLFKADKPVTTSSLKVTIPALGNPEQVQIGRIGVYNYLLDLFALTDSNYKTETNQGNYRTLSGNIVFYGDYKKWESKIKIENLPQAQFNTINAAVQTDNILTVIPFKDFEPSAVYECYIAPDFSFEVDRKTALYSATLEAKEL